MMYNLTDIAVNTTGVLGFAQGVNTVLTDGWLFTLVLIGIAAITFMSFSYATNNTPKSLSATSFVCLSLCLLLRALELVGNITLLITIIIGAATVAVTFHKD